MPVAQPPHDVLCEQPLKLNKCNAMHCNIVSHKSNVRIYDHMHTLQNMDSRLPSSVAAIPWQIIVSKHLTCQKKNSSHQIKGNLQNIKIVFMC